MFETCVILAKYVPGSIRIDNNSCRATGKGSLMIFSPHMWSNMLYRAKVDLRACCKTMMIV